MAHAEHFLSRIARLNGGQADLALSLYRDPVAVKALLARARAPERAGRIALALDDGEAPPHLVVTSDGKFVTCLGEGMRTNGTPVVPWAQVDEFLAGAAELRERMAHYNALVRDRGTGVIRPLFDNGCRVSRETIAAVIAIRPLLQHEFLEAMSTLVRAYYTIGQRIEAHKGGEKFAASSEGQELLDRHYCGLWAMAHLSVVLAADHVDCEQSVEWARLAHYFLMRPARDAHHVGTTLHGLWAVTQFGAHVFDLIEEDWVRPFLPTAMQLAAVALAALGRRHPALLFAAGKALQKTPSSDVAEVAAFIADGATPWRTLARKALDEPEATDDAFLEIGRMVAADVPDELLRSACASLDADLAADPQGALMGTCVPWIARARAEDLYLPAAEMDEVLPERGEEQGIEWYRHLLRFAHEPKPVVREGPRIGRNDPCACGSGRKLKKCCG